MASARMRGICYWLGPRFWGEFKKVLRFLPPPRPDFSSQAYGVALSSPGLAFVFVLALGTWPFCLQIPPPGIY